MGKYYCLSLLFVVLISGCISEGTIMVLDCGEDFECFSDSLGICQPALYTPEFGLPEEMTYGRLMFEVLGREGEDCLVNVRFVNQYEQRIEEQCTFPVGFQAESLYAFVLNISECITEEERVPEVWEPEGLEEVKTGNSTPIVDIRNSPGDYLGKTIMIEGMLDAAQAKHIYPEAGVEYRVIDWERLDELVQANETADDYYLLAKLPAGIGFKGELEFLDSDVFIGTLESVEFEVCDCEFYYAHELFGTGYYVMRSETGKTLVENCVGATGVDDPYPSRCKEDSTENQTYYYMQAIASQKAP